MIDMDGSTWKVDKRDKKRLKMNYGSKPIVDHIDDIN
jgi:hypothetical protein